MALARSTGSVISLRRIVSESTVRTKPDITSWGVLRFWAVYALVTYADFFNLLGYSTAGIGAAGKYALFLALFLIFGISWLRSSRSSLGTNSPTIFLLFTAISLIPLLVQLGGNGDTNTYASAFVPSLIYATGLTFNPREYRSDFGNLSRRLQQLLLVLCLLYDCELLLRYYGGLSYFTLVANQTNHAKAVAFVLALALAYLSNRSAWYIVMLLLLTVASVFLRPSSSLALALVIVVPLCVFMKYGLLRAALALTYATIVIAALAPFILYYYPEARDLIVSAEGAAKSEALGGASNAAVRLVIMEVAFQRIEASSWLVGELFSGGTAVQVSGLLSFWTANYSSGLAQIHSDYVCVLLEGGLLGYVAFNLAFMMIAQRSLRAGRSFSKDHLILQRTGAISAITLIIYCSANPMLQGYQLAAFVWGLLLISYVSSEGDHREPLLNPAKSHDMTKYTLISRDIMQAGQQTGRPKISES